MSFLPLCCSQKKVFWKRSQAPSPHTMKVSRVECWTPLTFIVSTLFVHTFFKISSFVFHRRKKYRTWGWFFFFLIIVSSAVLEEMQLSVQLYSDTTSKSFNMSKNIDWYKLDSQLFSGICLCTTYSCMCFWVLVIWLQWIHVDMLQRQGQFYEAGLTEHLSVLVSGRCSSGKRQAGFDGIIWPLLSGLTVSWAGFSSLLFITSLQY